MNKNKENKIIEQMKNTPKSIYLLILLVLGVEIYYFYSFISHGLMKYYGYSINSLSSGEPIILTFLLALVVTSLILITYGFLLKKTWVRKYTLVFTIWSMIWPIWGLLVGVQLITHAVLLMLYISLLLVLMSNPVKNYFPIVYHYGDYILYKRYVKLKNGKSLPIYFFSKKKPKSGKPSPFPSRYVVKENERSHMPYLTKRRATKI